MVSRAKIRLHLFAILTAMTVFGYAFNRFLLMSGLHSLVGRNLTVMIASYVSFFAFIRVWLTCLEKDPSESLKQDQNELKTFPLPDKRPDSLNKKSKSSWRDWFNPLGVIDGDMLFIIVLIALVILLIVAGIWISAEGSTILIDAAFDASLSVGLVGTANIIRGDWHKGVLRRTILPFLIVLSLSLLITVRAASTCPGRDKLSEVVHQCWLVNNR